MVVPREMDYSKWDSLVDSDDDGDCADAVTASAQSPLRQCLNEWNRIKGRTDDIMTSGDYEHLLKVFDSYFGKFVTLYR